MRDVRPLLGDETQYRVRRALGERPMQQEIDALKMALLQDDSEAGAAAAVAVLGAFALLFERGVCALERLADAAEWRG